MNDPPPDVVPTKRYPFPVERRLRRPQDFERVYALRNRAGDNVLLIFAAVNDTGLTRIGLSVSRKQGNSVRRHRLRRLLKEAYRLEQHRIAEGLDLILIPGRELRNASLADIRRSLVQLTDRLAARLHV